MYGEPALPSGFSELPYVNPDAPPGGRITFGASGSFDSLNPWIVKGRAPWALRSLIYEPLMGRNWDEPFSLYGLLAESIETDEARSWVEFTLRPEARFSDGTPVTVEDVMWSFEILGTEGHPRYRTAWKKLAGMEQTGPRSIRFTLNTVDRELPLILGLRPILRKADWEGREFGESAMHVPIGSGPYILDGFEAGRYLSFKRNPEYWGNHLGFNRGRHNFEEIRHEYFGDGGVVFEAFKAGEISSYREWNSAKWENQYDFPAVRSGDVVKSLIPHQRPSGIRGFVFNTRRQIFEDWRVRDALIHAFNFEFINNTLNDGLQPRITSYFSNSELGMREGPAEGRVHELLSGFVDELHEGALEGYRLPQSDGSERNRGNIRKALERFEEAGWTVADDGVLRNADGIAFSFEILLVQGSAETLAITNIFSEALKRLGVDVHVTVIDSAQYKERTTEYDFDMAWYRRAMSLSPGNEQKLYWGSEGVELPGTRNWMGLASPAVESMIDEMLAARSKEDFIAAVRALDRLLTTGRYVIPVWYSDHSRIAHRKELKFPDKLPIYGDWIGFQPDVWWYAE
ncbi:MAG: extracellular solute-binding protein [Rhodobacteraceae bacterium]|nr:extracellular solute-binding protein [Paracoccaceae bacterium]